MSSVPILPQMPFFSKPLVFLFPCDKETGWNFFGAWQLCKRPWLPVNVTGCACILHNIKESSFFRTWAIATMEQCHLLESALILTLDSWFSYRSPLLLCNWGKSPNLSEPTLWNGTHDNLCLWSQRLLRDSNEAMDVKVLCELSAGWVESPLVQDTLTPNLVRHMDLLLLRKVSILNLRA